MHRGDGADVGHEKAGAPTPTNGEGTPVRSARQWVEERLAGVLIQPVLLVALASLAFLTWRLRKELVILFAAVFFGISLYKGARWLVRHTGIPHGAAVGVWFVLFLALGGGFSVFAGTQLTDQYGELGERIPAALEQVEVQLEGIPILSTLGGQLSELRASMTGEEGEDSGGPGAREGDSGGQQGDGSRTMRFVQVTLTTLGHVGLILLLAFYLAYDGRRYKGALVLLVPPAHRDVGRDLFAALAHALPWWLVGRLASMAVVAGLTTPALYLLDIPLALLLGLIAGIFSFVPVLGPLAAIIPATLVTLEADPSKIVWVLALYMGVQLLESWFITPKVQEKVSEMPPFLLLSAQLVLGVLVGIWGVMFSTPVALAALVGVQVLWLRHTLGEELETPGADVD